MTSNISNNGTLYSLTGSKHSPTLVFIHGIGLSHRIWDNYVAYFENDYTVLRYDLLGHGGSVNPKTPPNLTAYAVQLKQLLHELEIDKVILVGFSLGGMINRRFAMDYPDMVVALAILNSPHERTQQAQKLVEQRVRDTSAGGVVATIDETLARWFTEKFRNDCPDVVQQVAAGVLANDDIVYAECRMVLATGVIELIRPHPPIKTPALVITCENDSGSTPQMSQAISAEITDSQVVIVPHLQHMGLIEQPRLFTQLILDFLNNHLRVNRK